jgi:hypothetical protein
VDGFVEQRKELEKLMMSNPAMEKKVQGLIRKVLMEARKHLGDDAKQTMKSDPRHAYRAVKTAVYKQILGGNINILSPYKRGAATNYQRPRKLDQNPHQRGGNRRQRSMETLRYESYHGVDRGFILRFQNQGTTKRETRFGNRGSLRARNWFGISSTIHTEEAVNTIVKEIENALDAEFKLM